MAPQPARGKRLSLAGQQVAGSGLPTGLPTLIQGGAKGDVKQNALREVMKGTSPPSPLEVKSSPTSGLRPQSLLGDKVSDQKQARKELLEVLLGTAGEQSLELGRQASEATSKSSSSSEVAQRPSSRSLVNREAFQACRNDLDISSAYLWEAREELGNGAFGRVFKVRSRFDTKKFVAVKEVEKADCSTLNELRSEISILTRLDHPLVLRFYESYEDHRQIYIITELCAGGDLSQCMTEVQGDLAFSRHVARQSLKALTYCHSQGICHRDLKPENIFLLRKLGETRDPPLRLADFGLAKQFENSCSRKLQEKLGGMKAGLKRMTSFKGTPEYMSPEVLAVLNAKVNYTVKQPYYDFRCDIWSVGVIVHRLLTGEGPYDLEELASFVEKGKKLAPLSPHEALREEVFAFLARCLEPDCSKRPSAEELLADTFLQHSAAAEKLFALIDKDGSGSVEASELLDYMLGSGQEPETVCELFGALDTNKDGIISEEEFQKGFGIFTTYDRTQAKPHMQDLAVLSNNVDSFVKAPPLKKAALTAAARHLGGYELYELRQIFEHVDSNADGAITLQEWRESWQSLPSKSSDWVDEAFSALDTDGSGAVDYTEFLAGVMDSQIAKRKDLAWAAFKAFDHHSTGSISKADLQRVLVDMGEHERVMSMAETDEHGEISFDAFLDLLHDQPAD